MHEILDEPEILVSKKVKPDFTKIVALAIIHSFFTLSLAYFFIDKASFATFTRAGDELTSFVIYYILENWFTAYLLVSLDFVKKYNFSRSILTATPIFLFGVLTINILYVSLYIISHASINAFLTTFSELLITIIHNWQFVIRYFVLGILSVTGMYFLHQKAYLKTIFALTLSMLIFLIPLTGYCWMCQ